MDSMRALLMMLGVVLHSAQVFNPDTAWLLHSARSTPVAGWLVDVIFLFRMPAFFIVAGFFCVLSLRKHGPHQFAVLRLERIAVPLLVAALLLNSLQTLLLTGNGLMDFELRRYLADGEWASHLWFLVHLLVYFALAYLVIRRGWSWPAAALRGLATALARLSPVVLLVTVASGHLFLLKAAGATGALGLGVVAGLFDVYSLAWYLPFFAFGLAVAVDRRLLDRFAGVPALAGIALVGACAWLADPARAFDGPAARIGAEYAGLLATWAAAALCFHAFRRFANRRSPLMTYLAGASYTVYLFHHVLVVAFALVLIEFGVGGVAGLVTLVAAVTAAALGIHRSLVLRSAHARFLFNGIRSEGAAPAPVSLARRGFVK